MTENNHGDSIVAEVQPVDLREMQTVQGGIATLIATPTAAQETDWLGTGVAVTSIQWSVQK